MAQKKQTPVKVEIPEFDPESMPLSCTWIIIGPPASGKCFGKDTPVLMYDMSIKMVQDIVDGDLVMGDDSTPRKVRGVCTGQDYLFKIQNEMDGTFHIVNRSHVICLKREYIPHIVAPTKSRASWKSPRDPGVWMVKWMKNTIKQRAPFDSLEAAQSFLDELSEYTVENIMEISVYRYMNTTVDFKKGYKIYRVGIDRATSPIDIPETDARLFGEHMAKSILTTGTGFIPDNILKASKPIRLAYLEGLSYLGGISPRIPIPRDDYSKFELLIRSVGYTPTEVRSAHGERRLLYSKTEKLEYHYTIDPVSAGGDGKGTYYGFQVDGNGRFLLGDLTVTHNTTLMENFAYFLKHRYPVGRVFIGTEDGYNRFCNIFHKLYVSNYWSEEEEERYIRRQRTCTMENGKGYPGNYGCNIIDDVSDDPKIYKTKLMRGIFKLGSQHWAQLAMIGSQYAIDMPPDIRKSVSYVALGREPEQNERKKLYDNFGGLAGSYERFCDLMDQITGDHTFLIFKKRSQSNDLEDCVSWFQTKQLGDWKFGCKEYRKHAEERYDPNYVEQIIM